mmetsp:Transcript_10397/g.40446  ORF Transcript_10397/g.40446 Transcript_10397/m.40446 type:complete len:285 (-) Transcript_10397:423-1277(-)
MSSDVEFPPAAPPPGITTVAGRIRIPHWALGCARRHVAPPSDELHTVFTYAAELAPAMAQRLPFQRSRLWNENVGSGSAPLSSLQSWSIAGGLRPPRAVWLRPATRMLLIAAAGRDAASRAVSLSSGGDVAPWGKAAAHCRSRHAPRSPPPVSSAKPLLVPLARTLDHVKPPSADRQASFMAATPLTPPKIRTSLRAAGAPAAAGDSLVDRRLAPAPRASEGEAADAPWLGAGRGSRWGRVAAGRATAPWPPRAAKGEVLFATASCHVAPPSSETQTSANHSKA